jgi:hypothetical protein
MQEFRLDHVRQRADLLDYGLGHFLIHRHQGDRVWPAKAGIWPVPFGGRGSTPAGCAQAGSERLAAAVRNKGSRKAFSGFIMRSPIQ